MMHGDKLKIGDKVCTSVTRAWRNTKQRTACWHAQRGFMVWVARLQSMALQWGYQPLLAASHVYCLFSHVRTWLASELQHHSHGCSCSDNQQVKTCGVEVSAQVLWIMAGGPAAAMADLYTSPQVACPAPEVSTGLCSSHSSRLTHAGQAEWRCLMLVSF